MASRIFSGSTTVIVPDYDIDSAYEGAHALAHSFFHFKAKAVREHLMEPKDIVCGMENFVLFPHKQHAPGVEGIFPAYLIGAFEGYRRALYDKYKPSGYKHYTMLTLQLPSTGLRFNTQEHLKQVNAWVVGKQHERAAFSHIWAYLLSTLR